MITFRKKYVETVVTMVRGFFVIFAAAALTLSVVALVDLSFGLNWGFTLIAIPTGVGMAVAALGTRWVVKMIGLAMGRIEEFTSGKGG